MLKLQEILPQTPHPKSLTVSWKEGVAASVMIAVTDEYLIPLGLFLGATPFEIGLLVAVPHLLGSFAQFFASGLVTLLGSRLRFLAKASALQAFFLLPLSFLPLYAFPERIGLLIFLVTIFRVMGNLIGTVWGSLASDYLLPEDRGKYFGWRSRIVGFSGMAATVLGGIWLNSFKMFSTAWGFCLLFAVASLARFISSRFMGAMENIPYHKKPGDHFTFLMFLRRFRQSNFVKFVLYIASITFATGIAAPFFSVYMLRDLHFSYLTYMLVHMGAVIAGLVSFPIWGRHADLVGNARVLKTTSLFIPLIPFLWIVSHNIYYLFCVEVFAGFVWGGFNLCTLNFIYDAVSPGKRVRCLSYFSFINGLAIFLGAGLGGVLAEKLPFLNGSRLCSLLLVSGCLRLLSHFVLSRHFQEVRPPAQKVSSTELVFSVVGIRPILGRDQEWYIFPFLKKKT